MIKEIKLQSVASFGDTPVSIKTDKQVNLFYGLNGTGKSTIGRFLRNYNHRTDDSDNSKYESCKLDFDQEDMDVEILVYNQDFIKENFYEKDIQSGIFIIGKKDIEVEQTIENTKKNIREIKEKFDQYEQDKEGKKKKFGDRTEAVKDKVFALKHDYEKKELDYCLERVKRRQPFFDLLVNTSFEKVEYTFEDLIEEVKEIDEEDVQQKTLLQLSDLSSTKHENDSIWGEVIIGTGDSYLKNLIEKLQNSDWVNAGKKFLSSTEEQCPFCQQNLPAGFKMEIEKLFDQTYQERTKKIQILYTEYGGMVQNFEKLFENNAFTDEYVKRNHDFQSQKKFLISNMKTNLEKIKAKKQNPSAKIELINTEQGLNSLEKSIGTINSEIKVFNKKILDIEKSWDDIKDRFWKLARYKYNADIKEYKSLEGEHDKDIKGIDSQLESLSKQIKTQKNIIKENRSKITNIEESIENINNSIQGLGLVGFSIEKEKEGSQSYKIKRDSQSENDSVYETLSEGEKNLITFLYFLECCDGAENQDMSVDLTKRIVVVDDPISSLSHIYIYDVAHMIHTHFFKKNGKWKLNIGQLFILTHSLYFFNELLRLFKFNDVKQNLYRVIKKSLYSSVVPMNEKEIQNDYQAFWQIYKENISSNTYTPIIPNVMRNILEYYFLFICNKDNLYNVLKKLISKEIAYKPLYRYINRESHSNRENLNDWKEFNPSKYQEAFKKIFKETGHMYHYDAMMGVEEVVH